ncbi:MAG: hypothetical protein JNJ46_17425 [Myxococcales bacterium]|nr:hypothetical protein [Myxococcales bacterium]
MTHPRMPPIKTETINGTPFFALQASAQPVALRRVRDRWALPGLLAVGLVACGGDGEWPPTTVGQSILSKAVTAVTLQNPGGGFTPAPPAGSKCLVGGRMFTVPLATGTVAYTKCIGDGVVPYMPMSGSRTLTDAELGDVKAQLAKLTVVKPPDACITDVPMLTVLVETSTTVQSYADDGFPCQVKDKPFLSRSVISDVMGKLDTLTK